MKELWSFYQKTQEDEGSGVRTFIVKPESLCQGKGIYLIWDLNMIIPGENYVV